MADLKPGWKSVALGDVVDVVTDYWDRQSTERFVAGQHIDEGQLKVTRWGMTSDELVPPTFNRRFRAGDVLFHSRNLKKLACPDFDGLTGEKLFVLRSRDPIRLLPGLLPFLLQTDTFSEYVNRMWAGSTNKFLNKAPLIKYEFALPPLEEQRRLVELLSTAAKVRELYRELDAQAQIAEMAEVQAWFTDRHAWPHMAMHRCGEIQLGQQKHPKFERGENMRPFLRVANLSDGYLDVSDIQRMSFPGSSATKHQLKVGDLLVTEGDLIGPQNVGRTAMYRGEIEDCCVQKTLIRVRPRADVVLPGYLLWVFRHLRYDGTFAKAASGSTVAHLVQEKFRDVPCPVAPRGIQERIAEASERWYRARPVLQQRLTESAVLQHMALNAAVGR